MLNLSSQFHMASEFGPCNLQNQLFYVGHSYAEVYCSHSAKKSVSLFLSLLGKRQKNACHHILNELYCVKCTDVKHPLFSFLDWRRPSSLMRVLSWEGISSYGFMLPSFTRIPQRDCDFESGATEKWIGTLLCGILSFLKLCFSSALILTPPAGNIFPDSS